MVRGESDLSREKRSGAVWESPAVRRGRRFTFHAGEDRTLDQRGHRSVVRRLPHRPQELGKQQILNLCAARCVSMKQETYFMRQIAVLFSLLCSVTAFAADPQLMNLVMPDAKILAGGNETTAIASPFGQFILSKIGQLPQGLIAATGFNPLQDVSEVLGCHSGGSIQPRRSGAGAWYVPGRKNCSCACRGQCELASDHLWRRHPHYHEAKHHQSERKGDACGCVHRQFHRGGGRSCLGEGHNRSR